jgi:hypothetical protein
LALARAIWNGFRTKWNYAGLDWAYLKELGLVWLKIWMADERRIWYRLLSGG